MIDVLMFYGAYGAVVVVGALGWMRWWDTERRLRAADKQFLELLAVIHDDKRLAARDEPPARPPAIGPDIEPDPPAKLPRARVVRRLRP